MAPVPSPWSHYALMGLPGAAGVHDLHVWTITSGMESLPAHLVVDGYPAEEVLRQARRLMNDRFGIGHITIQVEPEGFQERGSPI